MNEVVQYRIEKNIAVITFIHPPVNVFSYAQRIAVQECMERAIQDNSIEAIVFIGSGRFFSAGADIKEFADGTTLQTPTLTELVAYVSTSPKLTVAALNGTALGGGCEIALACHYRIATDKVKIGLPEINLGILPGACGTQLLPRVAGPQIALDMILSGKPITASEALEKKIVDHVHAGSDFEQAVYAYVRKLLAEQAPLRNPNETLVDTTDLADDFFDRYRESIANKTRGQLAPDWCIRCVQAACELPFAEGLAFETKAVMECFRSPQSRALQHLFFAEREAKKIPGIDSDTPLRPIKKVAVIGAGTMGGGIAMNFANTGTPVILLDRDDDAVTKGIATIRKNYEFSAKRGRFTDAQVEERMGLIISATDYAALADVDLVIEAVFEDMDIKKQVFETLDNVCKPGAILATNTSTLNVDDVAAVTNRPEDVIGLHFFSPANVMKLLEIVRAQQTAADVVATCLNMATGIGKVPVVVGVCFGFVGNRMLEPYCREACRLLLEGASPEQVDRVLTDFGMAMGVFSMTDLAGIDVGFRVRESNRARFSKDPTVEILSDRLYALGRYGQKTGRGYYIYEGREQRPDPEVITLAEEIAAEFGIERREISDQEILERCLYPLINEGANILEEGIALRAGDIDLVYTCGYGFPRWRGGPMHYANEIGLETVLNGMKKYQTRLGDYGRMWYTPAPSLERLVRGNSDFDQNGKPA